MNVHFTDTLILTPNVRIFLAADAVDIFTASAASMVKFGDLGVFWLILQQVPAGKDIVQHNTARWQVDIVVDYGGGWGSVAYDEVWFNARLAAV